jgi:hypothetical protein
MLSTIPECTEAPSMEIVQTDMNIYPADYAVIYP